MKPGSKLRRLAGVVAVAVVTAACAPIVGTSGPRSLLDMPPAPGGLTDVAARSSSSALAVGKTAHSRVLVARWNGAVWKTLSDRALPRLSDLAAAAVFPGGGWVVGEYGLTDHGDGGGVGRPLILRVTGTTMRRVPVQKLSYSSALEDVAATSLASAWAVIRFRTGNFPRLMHWNGSQWGVVVMPDFGVRYGLYSVAATSARNVWPVGSGVILHWNGRRWTCASIRNTLFAVSTSSADNAWAVGGGGGQAVALHWNGHTWKQEVLTPTPRRVYFLQGVAAVPRSGRAWAVGSTESTDTKTLMLHWNGTAWR